jgi:hypothetical protein
VAHTFKINSASLLRKFAVYVVIAKGKKDTKIYVGKTGDNREGCNPVISRCGNHFSYNKIHSQVRNKLGDHEDRSYTYVFDHFGDYTNSKRENQRGIDEINEMERWLNEEMQTVLVELKKCELINPFKGNSYIPQKERDKRQGFRKSTNKKKISGIVKAALKELKATNH